MINKSNGTNLSFADYAKEWQSIWMKVLETNQETVRESVKAMLPNLQQQEEFPVTIFDPEIVVKTLHQAVRELSKKPQSIHDLQTDHFKKVLKLMETVTHHLKGEDVTPLMTVDAKDKRFKILCGKIIPLSFLCSSFIF